MQSSATAALPHIAKLLLRATEACQGMSKGTDTIHHLTSRDAIAQCFSITIQIQQTYGRFMQQQHPVEVRIIRLAAAAAGGGGGQQGSISSEATYPAATAINARTSTNILQPALTRRL